MSNLKIITAVGAIAAMSMLGGCAAVVPLAVAGAGMGALDVSALNGCVGVTMSNWIPWTQKYDCKVRPVTTASAGVAQ